MLVRFKDVVIWQWLNGLGSGKLPDHVGPWLENLKEAQAMRQARALSGVASKTRLHRPHNIGRLTHSLLRVMDSIHIIIPSLNTFLERLCQFGCTETADAAS